MTQKPTYEELEKRIQELEQIDLDRNHVEEALREDNERFLSITNTAMDSIFCKDINRQYTFVNPSMVQLFGCNEADIIGKTPEEIFDKETADIIHDVDQRTLNGEKVSEERTLTIAGIPYFFHTIQVPLLDSSGNIKGISGIVRDITCRKQTEEALRESNSSLQSVFEAVPVGICFLKDRVYQRANKDWCDRFGYSEKSLLGRTTKFLYEKKEEHERVGKELYEQILENGIALVNTRLKRSNGEFLEVDLIAKQLNPQDIADGTVVVVHDITEQKRAEKEKIKAQKIASAQKRLALVGQIAGKMAHDFNNILGIIMGNSELGLLYCKDAQTRKTFELIFKQTLRGKNLTKDLIAFAKSQEPKQEFFRINEKIDLVINLMKKDLESISLIKDDASNVPALLADPGMIEHALVNFVQNSIHAVSMIKNPKIIIRSFCLNNNICIEIEDNGCGIPEESLDNIYEPSFTLKGSRDTTGSYKPGIKGTGYGLSNIRKYIEQHKGNIIVDSKVGNGTKFTVCLPVIKPELTSEEKKEVQKENFYFEKYILVVEDEQDISDVQYKILTHEPCNHKVDIAANAQMAIDLFERNKYDFVSLDYILPGEFNGMDVYKHIRKTNDTLPILFVSGNLNFLESIKELKHNDPCVDHISKPCQNKDYVNAINELLKKCDLNNKSIF